MQGKSNDSAETASAVADEYIDVDDDTAAADDDDDESTNEIAGALCRWLITFS